MQQTISILGCGWLGLPLAEHFVKLGYAVKGSTTQQEKRKSLIEKNIQAYTIDLTHSITDEVLIDFLQTDVLIVTIPPRSRTQAPGVYHAQVKGLVDVLKKQRSIKHLIYTSSTSVYPDKPGLAKESDVMDIDHASHKELVEVEQLLLSIPNLDRTIIRLGGLTGGSRLLVKHFSGKKGLEGGGHPVNLIHLEDAVGVVAWAVSENIGGVLNACSPVHPRKKDFYQSLARRFQMSLPEFNEEHEEGKTIDTEKLEQSGYIFTYPDPQLYTYDQQ
ncbi:MAG: yeeZ [Chitinophagaceae bacterium]|nr:yeeZ [Chitinophagaceae bacterium]